jgi:hypothetical protein
LTIVVALAVVITRLLQVRGRRAAKPATTTSSSPSTAESPSEASD